MIEVYTDGGSIQNPSFGVIAGCITFKNKPSRNFKWCNEIARCTSNEAEYAAVISALFVLDKLKIYHYKIRMYSDSRLVVNQVNGKWKANISRLEKKRNDVLSLLDRFTNIKISWVPRENNKIKMVDKLIKNKTREIKKQYAK